MRESVDGLVSRRRVFEILVAGVFCLTVALTAVGCVGTSSSPNSGLATIRNDQKEARAFDARGAAFQRRKTSLSYAVALDADYHRLLSKARGQRPTSAMGDEATVWKSFIGILAAKSQVWDIVVRATRAGDFSHLDSDLAPLYDKGRALSNDFNHALGSLVGGKPPPDQPVPTAAIRASATQLSQLVDRMNAIDRRAIATIVQLRSPAETRANIATRRVIVGDYSQLLSAASAGARRASRLPTSGVGIGQVWSALVSMIRARREEAAYIVGVFEQALNTKTLPPDFEARVGELNKQLQQTDPRFKKLAKRLDQQLGGG
jgi:hypothetical protein